MLPTLRVLNSRVNKDTIEKDLKKSSVSKAGVKTVEEVLAFEQKCEKEMNLNQKLKQLLDNIKSNVSTSEMVSAEEQQVTKIMKERRKEQTQVQHQAHILNILIAGNGKLKEQVDSERNKRAIYFNVYKNLEHEIHHWEVKYKNLLIESIKSEGAITKIKQRFRKASKKIEKDIQSITNEIDKISKVDELQHKNEEKPKPVKDTLSLASQKKIIIKTDEIETTEKTDRKSEIVPIDNKKTQDEALEYELEQKNIEVSGIINRLKQITKLDDLKQIKQCYKTIDEQIQYHFSLFIDEQKREKQLTDQLEMHQKQIHRVQTENVQRKSTKVTKIEGEKQLQIKLDQIRDLEKNLEAKIGIKVGQMSNEMLLHYCIRVRDEKKDGKKNLQKYLQQAKKQKPQSAILLSPKEMHKKIIQNQTMA